MSALLTRAANVDSDYRRLYNAEFQFYQEKSRIQKGFEYHNQSKEIEFVNLSFADDLFVLSAASVRAVKSVLKVFGEVSGLHPNLSKSTCYFAGVNDRKANELSSMLGISVGCLPVRYLGIPLTTKQLKAQDCRVLIDKISHKIDRWGMSS
ncbi:hypothetical protein LIER_20624 [Lithospermum erythrorhizon]|uniref:Reverse transcriptase n=1 Tax=Lithospermum erythrorhizon TaxID=34254 RepID=A0AAV3QPZ6_LITER